MKLRMHALMTANTSFSPHFAQVYPLSSQPLMLHDRFHTAVEYRQRKPERRRCFAAKSSGPEEGKTSALGVLGK
jgi:hypothetical protein